MTLKVSTGLRNGLLDSGSLKSQLDGGRINIYAGAVPASADESLGSATLLCAVTLNSAGSGINFDTAAVGDTLSKAPGQVWSGVNAATGTATFYRHVAAGDDGTLSTSAPRLQGEVGTAGKELNLSSINLTSGATQTIDYYSVTQPTL